MTLNETQSASVCLAYQGMMAVQDAAQAAEICCHIYMDVYGSLIVEAQEIPGPLRELRFIKDRNPKEIDDYLKTVINAIKDLDNADNR